jgi:hypothetical protein
MWTTPGLYFGGRKALEKPVALPGSMLWFSGNPPAVRQDEDREERFKS